MHIVAAQDVAAHRPVASGINRAGVVRLLADVRDFVVFNDDIVAAKSHAHVRRVFDKIVRNPIADAVGRNSRRVHALHATVIMNVVLLNNVFAGNQLISIAPAHGHSASAKIPEFAPGNRALNAVDVNARASAVRNVKIRKRNVLTARTDDRGSARAEHIETGPLKTGRAF